MEWETKRGRKHIGWGMQFEWQSRSHWKVTYDWQSQGGEGLLVTLSRTAGKCFTCSRHSKVACLALTERSIRKEVGAAIREVIGGRERMWSDLQTILQVFGFASEWRRLLWRVLSRWVTWPDLRFNKITGCCAGNSQEEGKVGQDSG